MVCYGLFIIVFVVLVWFEVYAISSLFEHRCISIDELHS